MKGEISFSVKVAIMGDDNCFFQYRDLYTIDDEKSLMIFVVKTTIDVVDCWIKANKEKVASDVDTYFPLLNLVKPIIRDELFSCYYGERDKNTQEILFDIIFDLNEEDCNLISSNIEYICSDNL